MVDADYAEFLEEGSFALEQEAPEVTFDRGDRAIARLRQAKAGSPLSALRALLFGQSAPKAVPEAQPLSLFDPQLNPLQRHAVTAAVQAPEPISRAELKPQRKVVRSHLLRKTRLTPPLRARAH